MRCVDQEWGVGRGSWIRRTILQAVEKGTLGFSRARSAALAGVGYPGLALISLH